MPPGQVWRGKGRVTYTNTHSIMASTPGYRRCSLVWRQLEGGVEELVDRPVSLWWIQVWRPPVNSGQLVVAALHHTPALHHTEEEKIGSERKCWSEKKCGPTKYLGPKQIVGSERRKKTLGLSFHTFIHASIRGTEDDC